MNRITLIRLELNNWNGFIFEVLDIEYGSFEGALFGIHFAKSFLVIDFLFVTIEVSINW